jgi:hypothetical protein
MPINGSAARKRRNMWGDSSNGSVRLVKPGLPSRLYARYVHAVKVVKKM